jgi:hypothetical protein
MPTFEVQERFRRDYLRLRPEQRAQFRDALREFVRVLRESERTSRPGIPRFPQRLGVKPMVNRRSVPESAWAPDGRSTWEYGASPRDGMWHVVWRRIGTHAIYEDP